MPLWITSTTREIMMENDTTITMQMVSDCGEGQAGGSPEERETFYIETLTRIANGKYSASQLQGDASGEAQCITCGVWIHEGDVILATEDGRLTTDIGDPYCDACLPEEK